MENGMYGSMIIGAIMWAVGFMLLVQAVSTQWASGMNAMVFVYYLVGFVVINYACVNCCKKCLCMSPKK